MKLCFVPTLACLLLVACGGGGDTPAGTMINNAPPVVTPPADLTTTSTMGSPNYVSKQFVVTDPEGGLVTVAFGTETAPTGLMDVMLPTATGATFAATTDPAVVWQTSHGAVAANAASVYRAYSGVVASGSTITVGIRGGGVLMVKAVDASGVSSATPHQVTFVLQP